MSNISGETQNKKKALGRGLGSLLGGAPPVSEKAAPAETSVKTNATPAPAAATVAPPVNPDSRIWQVAIDKLSPGQYQPRRVFVKENLQELAQSIKENGILQPIVARRTANGKLEIVAGERRWRAAQLASMHEVPVILKNFNDKEALELAIVENIQREDLSPLEEAEGYARLASEFKLSQQQIAEKVGKDRATVANAIRLLGLPEEVKNMIAANTLTVGHAKVLLGLPDHKKQIELAKKVIGDKMPVRKLEKMVQAILKGNDEVLETKPADESVTQRLISGLGDELQKLLGTKVNIDYSNSKGKISIHFYSDDELTNLVERLKEGWQQ